jgi:hypothetical protein
MTASLVLPHILRLDPERDHQQIVFLSCCYDFPFDVVVISNLILLRSFAAPRIAAVAEASGRFSHRGTERGLEMATTIGILVGHGYDSGPGEAVIARMNQAHRHYQDRNEDFLYVLSRLVLELEDWTARFGWRATVEQERQALFHFWREVGRRMHVRDIPPSYQALRRYSDWYEERHCRPSEAGHRVYKALEGVWLASCPLPLWPAFRLAIPSLLDESLRHNLGLPRLPPLRSAVVGLVRLCAHARAWLPPHRRPFPPFMRLEAQRSGGVSRLGNLWQALVRS